MFKKLYSCFYLPICFIFLTFKVFLHELTNLIKILGFIKSIIQFFNIYFVFHIN